MTQVGNIPDSRRRTQNHILTYFKLKHRQHFPIENPGLSAHRQTDRQTDRDRESQRETETERQRDRERDDRLDFYASNTDRTVGLSETMR